MDFKTKQSLREDLAKAKKEKLKYKTLYIKLCDILDEYDKTNGNAYTYIRKISNNLRYNKT